MRFEPDIHKALWGEEEWLVSAHASAPSRLLGSALTLRDIVPRFPILVKKIRAEKRLSVQVHPNEASAHKVGGEPKTEMWQILKAGPIFAGFRPGTTREQVERALETKANLEELLVRIDTRVGEAYYIPGGLVHALGEGTTVFEVQQSSDTTFRLYDWGRVDADGKPRKVHVKEALAAMELSLPPPEPRTRIDSPYFRCYREHSPELAPSVAWRVVYESHSGVTTLLPPGERLTLASEALIAEVEIEGK